jgi:hypothetical protein
MKPASAVTRHYFSAAVQAQLDGAPLPAAPAAAVLDEAHLLPMIEDELDADTHSWLPSLRQVCCAYCRYLVS